MTPEQRKQLIEATESGDDVKAVTLALQIAAWNAREGLLDQAQQCRRLVDELQRADSDRALYMQRRLEVAAAVIPQIMVQADAASGSPYCRDDVAAEAIRYADSLLEALWSIEIGG